MNPNDILDDFNDISPDETYVKTNWWAIFVSACFFLLMTFLKCKYLYPIMFSRLGISTSLHFIWLTILELVVFLLILRKQQYLNRDNVQTTKAAYLHAVVSYSIILIIFNRGKFIILDFFLAMLGISILGLPIIVVATMITDYITDRYMNKKT